MGETGDQGDFGEPTGLELVGVEGVEASARPLRCIATGGAGGRLLYSAIDLITPEGGLGWISS